MRHSESAACATLNDTPSFNNNARLLSLTLYQLFGGEVVSGWHGAATDDAVVQEVSTTRSRESGHVHSHVEAADTGWSTASSASGEEQPQMRTNKLTNRTRKIRSNSGRSSGRKTIAQIYQTNSDKFNSLSASVWGYFLDTCSSDNEIP